MKQTTFASTGFELVTKRTRKREFLEEMDIICPTEREARISTRNREEGLVVLTEKLRAQANAKNILLKLVEEGVLIHTGNGEADNWLT
jgi:sugar/nucleoside kinase (ribokinase family)